MPVFCSLPIKHKHIALAPMLEKIDMRKYLTSDIYQVSASGESGNNVRELRYEWVLDAREQCVDAGVKFHFFQTGANFVKDGKRYRILRKYQHSQARKANIDT